MTQCILLSYSTYWYYCIDDSLTISLYTIVHVEKKKQTHSTYVIRNILNTDSIRVARNVGTLTIKLAYQLNLCVLIEMPKCHTLTKLVHFLPRNCKNFHLLQ